MDEAQAQSKPKGLCRLCKTETNKSLLNLKGFPEAAQKFYSTAESGLRAEQIELQISQCSVCGLVQLENDPVDYYKDVITAASLSEQSKVSLTEEWKPFVTKYKLAGKPALEVGAGRGDFLQVLDRLGLVAHGLENSPENCEVCESSGSKVFNDYLLTWRTTEKYSLIVCNNFLEHQPDTRAFIIALRELLSDDGVLYISVPNLSYLLGKSCFYEFVADHLVYFTKSALSTALKSLDFEVLEEYEKNNGNDLVIVVQKKLPLQLTEGMKNYQEIVGSVKKLVEREWAAGKKIVVWGAGHRALALMALAGLKEISAVVDSAPFKQGLFTPILGKPILSPAEFFEIMCDVLIVMLPGAYANQVLKLLEDKNINCKVIIFNDEPVKFN
jgi:2-polyprenyl-3-methyl-5-hydroxy-6-metoxy-1,4-benzoquinol methylase